MINMFNEDFLDFQDSADVSTYKNKIKNTVGEVEPELDSFIETLALHCYLLKGSANRISMSKLLQNKSIV